MFWLKIILVTIPALAITVYFGLPWALSMMGLHPHYEIPAFDLAGKRALIITTSHDTLGDSGKATGVFGSEMSVPYYAFFDSGMEVDIASIKGGEIPVEPRSMGWPVGTESDYRFKKDTIAMAKLTNSIPVSKVDITKYDAIFLSGDWVTGFTGLANEPVLPAKFVGKIDMVLDGVLARINRHARLYHARLHAPGARGLHATSEMETPRQTDLSRTRARWTDKFSGSLQCAVSRRKQRQIAD